MSLKFTLDELIRRDVRDLSAYAVPDAQGLIKLDAMENPYRWPDNIKTQWLAQLSQCEINRYPDPRSTPLVQTIASAFAVPDKVSIMLGNGSDELIHILISAIAKPGAIVMAFEPGFVMYKYIALFNQVDYIPIPLDSNSGANFSIPLASTLQLIETHKPALIFIAYPNNPTGNLFEHAAIDQIIAAAPGLVVLDEAYTAFAKKSFLPQIKSHSNLLVLRTVSKMGLAGLRLGYLCGAPDWLTEFDKVRMPYNINVLTQVSVQFALQHKSWLDEQTDRLCVDRDWLFSAMRKIPGVIAYPTSANFILFRLPSGQGDKVFQQLLAQNILIKNLSHAGAMLADCLRVTVGTHVECEKFVAALTNIMDGSQ